ncbi:hypothetical protein CARUB_v10015020mg [Capsella rubella]|uniref:Uncharacterized protein n=1 Tax=Capsella rubella TaxID=81985 RepID=R0G837_9BRAS|nr:uncharacterized protein LOC17891047 [Capsella rubella]EOA31797.1 hypothetical protein CARUB_v10015020mg [Capsella rubella]
MAPSAAMLILSHPLISHKSTNHQSPSSSPAIKASTRVFGFLLPWKVLEDGKVRSKVGLWLFGDPDTVEKRFQEALELSCL